MTSPTNPEQSEWHLFRELGREALSRSRTPLRHPSFISFFILAVIGFGALGIWIEVYSLILPELIQTPKVPQAMDLSSLRAAVLTFFPAVAGTSAMQLIWGEKPKHFRSVSVLLLVIPIVVALTTSSSRVPDWLALSAGALMSVLSMWVWWIANGTHPDLLDKQIDPKSTLGDNNPLAPMRGSTEGFNT